MILVLGGTTEGRELAALLQQKGYNCLLSVAGELGEAMAASFSGEVHRGPLDRDGLKRLFRERGITAVIDATHPHAALITEYAQAAASETETPYARFSGLRPSCRSIPLFSSGRLSAGFRSLAETSGRHSFHDRYPRPSPFSTTLA